MLSNPYMNIYNIKHNATDKLLSHFDNLPKHGFFTIVVVKSCRISLTFFTNLIQQLKYNNILDYNLWGEVYIKENTTL